MRRRLLVADAARRTAVWRVTDIASGPGGVQPPVFTPPFPLVAPHLSSMAALTMPPHAAPDEAETDEESETEED